MSDLKFRAWHKERNKMLDVFGINFRTPATAQVLNDEYNHYEELLSRVELMQFTGLKDCNGDDIYEGDIIQDDEFYVSQIYWCDKTHMWACTDIGGLCDVPSEVKVIGNIYQNPELLEASK